MNFETNYLYAWEDINNFARYVEENKFEYVVIDTETNNKIEAKADLYGVGLCFQDNEAFYIPIKKQSGEKWWNLSQELIIFKLIREIVSTKKVVGHNLVYDTLVLNYNWELDITPYIYSDTILQKHLLDEEKPFALKEVGVKYLGAWADKAQEALYANIEANGGSTKKDNLEMYKAATDVLAEYCCHDVMITFLLFEMFEKRLADEGLVNLFYNEEIMPLYKEVTIPMKMRGFPVNVDYFKNLDTEISKEIEALEHSIQKSISNYTAEFCLALLNKDYPIKSSGTFPKVLAELLSLPLPEKNGKVTLAKKEVEKYQDSHEFYSWLLDSENNPLDKEILDQAQNAWYFKDNPDLKYIFNLNSNNHLKYLFFDELCEQPLGKTDGGEPQVDDDFLDSIKKSHDWVQDLLDYKKLSKLKSTYIEGVLERHIEGVIYSSFIQFGPPSGRYASRDPNLQNIPRVKEEDSGLSERVLVYVNAIKKGFIAGEGKKIVNADYSQLEPRAFSEACGDLLLQQIFIDKEDLYGSIAKNIWHLDCSANEVKKLYPEYRQKAKTIALAVVYGAEAGRISKLMNISYDEAQQIIDDYLNAYPGLKDYMADCDKQVCQKGQIATKFGRIRHLPMAKHIYQRYGFQVLNKKWAKQKGVDETRWKFKNMLNLAKNFPIQGVAAHVVNRGAIAISRRFKENNIEGGLVAQVHDELTCVVPEHQAELAKQIMKDCMENTTKLSVPLIAEPQIADNWAEAK